MTDRFAPFRKATASALEDHSAASPAELRDAIVRNSPPPELRALVEKIRSRAYAVTDQDLDVLRNRYTEDQLFEIIVVAAFAAAEERLTAARRALEEA
jgi:hypothetical protein